MAIFKIDVDGVLRDIITPMCKLYNEKFDENIKQEDILEYDVSTTFKKCDDIKNFYQLYIMCRFLKNLLDFQLYIQI